jgi:hypothetical protein
MSIMNPVARLAVVGAALIWAGQVVAITVTAQSASTAGQSVPLAVYSCPMHPDVRKTAPGSCPRCGMTLVSGGATSDDRFVLDVATEPSTPRPGQPVTLRFAVRRSEGGEIVRNFTAIHERVFHLFIVSDDLEYFDHIHPELTTDGSLEVTTVLPRKGRYQLYADFVPQAGTPQFLARTVYTAGDASDPAAKHVALAVNGMPQQSGDSIVELQLPPGVGLVSGELQAFRLHLRDVGSSAPIADLEPYLGAPAHLLAVSDDLIEGFHSHPALDYSSTSGPDIVFEAVFPRPGLYRMWVQFQRHERLHTVSFTVPVSLPPSAR